MVADRRDLELACQALKRKLAADLRAELRPRVAARCGGPEAAHGEPGTPCVCALPDAAPCGCVSFVPLDRVGRGAP